MNRNFALLLAVFFSLSLLSSEHVKSDAKGVSFEYVQDGACEKSIYFNVPEGEVRIHVGDASWDVYAGNQKEAAGRNLYEYSFEYAGRQRVLAIKIYPLKRQNSTTYILKSLRINLEFEKSLRSAEKPDPLLASSVNSGYVSYSLEGEASANVPFKSYLLIKVRENGIYRISYEDIKNAGINPANVSLSNTGLYTTSGVNLPADTSEYLKYLSPQKQPYSFFGDGDDDFESGEYVLFFGRSPHGDSFNYYLQYDIYNNPYTDYSSYMLVFSEENPMRAQNLIFSFNEDSSVLFTERVLHYDSINPLLSGYGWAWKKFDLKKDSGDFVYGFALPTPDIRGDSGEITLSFFFPFASETISMDISVNDSSIGTIEYGKENRYAPAKFAFPANNLSAMNNVKITAKNTDNRTKIFFLSECRVKYGADAGNPSDLLSVNCGLRYLPVTPSKDLYAFVKSDENSFLGKIAKNSENSIDLLNGDLLFITDEVAACDSIRWVDNSRIFSDLSGCDILIIAGDGFKESAIPYERYRKSMGLSVMTVEIGKIADAFGYGSPSPSAVKAFLDYGFGEWSNFPKYLLLLGSGSYDYKNRQNTYENRSVVPVYESGYGVYEEALLGASTTQCVDRWYALLTAGDQYIDIIPGRITALDRDEANGALMKIVDYETKSPLRMKNKAMVISDDEYGGRITEDFHETYFFADAEALSNLLMTRFPVRKLYLMDYFGSLQGSEEHWDDDPGYKRDVRFAFRDILNEGIAFGFFYGHGSYYTLTHEHILLYPDDINLFTNAYMYPIFLFGTCQAGQFDNDFGSVASEFQKLPHSGFSATVASTRAIFENESVDILHRSFAADLTEGGFNTIGEYYLSMINENTLFGTSHVLFGDPSMVTKRHLFDVSLETPDTLLLGSANQFSYSASAGGICADVYQPVYSDSHDYLHVLPYAYVYYDKSDGIMLRRTADSDSGNFIFSAPSKFDEREYTGEAIISGVSEDDSFVHSTIKILPTALRTDSSLSSGEIRFFVEGREIVDSSVLPSSYGLEVRFFSDAGIYMGNAASYLPQISAGASSQINQSDGIFSDAGDFFFEKFSVASSSSLDTLSALIYDSKLSAFKKSITVKHNPKAKTQRNFSLYPNPFSESFTVSFNSSDRGEIKWRLTDSRGFIASAGHELVEAGYNSLKIYPDGKIMDRRIEPGIYLLTAEFRYYGKEEVSVEKRKVVKI